MTCWWFVRRGTSLESVNLAIEDTETSRRAVGDPLTERNQARLKDLVELNLTPEIGNELMPSLALLVNVSTFPAGTGSRMDQRSNAISPQGFSR